MYTKADAMVDRYYEILEDYDDATSALEEMHDLFHKESEKKIDKVYHFCDGSTLELNGIFFRVGGA